MTPLIRVVSMLIAPVALLISISHLLGAEHGPGDGFTAGIILALALTLQFETMGSRTLPPWLMNFAFERVLFAGLGVVAVSALAPLAVGGNLLSPAGLAAELPVVGSLEITLSSLFDLGVALVVFGGAMTAINNLRAPDERQDRKTNQEET